MKLLGIIISLLLISPVTAHAGYNIDKLAKAINPIYPVWKINQATTKEKYGYQLLFNPADPGKIEIPDFKTVLNGQNYILLSCYGKIIPPAENGYVVGTANEGPTFGNIHIFDDKFHVLAHIASQKVVKIELLNLLGENTLQIVTWEDHHYGTNTTRRVLDIYRIDADKNLEKIFEHNLIDATGMPGNTDKVIYFNIDLQSLIKTRQILVVNKETADKEVFTWTGIIYKGPNDNCQQIN